MNWWRRKEREQDLERELRSHVEAEAEEQRGRGADEEEARYAARRALGNTTLVSEDVREAWGWMWLERLAQDVRFGLRTLRKNPSFTITAVLSLALGIGANAAIFGMIDALVLRALPVSKPSELVQVMWNISGSQSASFSYPVVQALAGHKELFSGVCGFSGNSLLVGTGDAVERVRGAWAAGAYYETLGLVPQVGRLLTAADDSAGAPLVAVISDSYWQRKFNRDPGIVGRSLTIQGQPVTIVGVSPPGFVGVSVGEDAEITIPLNAVVPLSPNRPDRALLLQAGYQWLRILARPAPGLSGEQVQAGLNVVWKQIAPVAVSEKASTKRREAVLASTLQVIPGATGWSSLRNQFRTPLYVLMTVVSLVLLIACANIANLLLARASARHNEIAVRLAVGASRTRIFRQLLTESLLLAALGAVAAIGVAQSGSKILLSLVSGGSNTMWLDLSLNARMLAFTMAVAIVSALLFGLAPALFATTSAPALALKHDTRTASGPRSRFAASLVSAQIAFSLLLVIAAGLFVRTLINLKDLDPGFRHEGVLLVDVDGRKLGYRDAALASFYQELLDKIRQTSGVISASLSFNTPVSGGYWSDNVTVAGVRQEGEAPQFNAVSPGYFETLHTALKLGRDFTWRDDASAPLVAIVNEAFVRRSIADGHALGQHISISDAPVYQNMEIVGVVKDTVWDLHKPSPPTVFLALFQAPPGRLGSVTIEIYADGRLSEVSSSVRDVVQRQLPAAEFQMRPFTQQVEDSLRQERLLAQLGSFFGVLALGLAAIGLYGVLNYTVVRRTGEIGIRMALGARRQQILSMVLAEALRLIGIGIVVGLPVAWWASRFVQKLLFGLRANDALTLVGAAVLLSSVAIVAALLPARRAAHVDPMVALRYE